MYSVGELLVYGANGVMRVTDVTEMRVGDDMHKYYVLEEVDRPSAGQTYVPIDNAQLTARMRPLLTREEIYGLLASVDELPGTEWSRDNRVRAERFKGIIESGDRARIIAMISDIYVAGKKRQSEGKKNYISDENVMRRAEKLLHSEFSIVLGIPEESVSQFIASEIEKNKK